MNDSNDEEQRVISKQENPVKCVFHVSVYFHEILPTGETGKSLSPSFNRRNGIKNRVLSFKAKPESKCIQEAIDLLSEIDDLEGKYK